MSKELKLSDIREWTGASDWTLAAIENLVGDCKVTCVPLGLAREFTQAILQNAPNECVQTRFNNKWVQAFGQPGKRDLDFTHRLCDGVTVVDDTAEDGEYEFVKVTSPSRGVWSFPHTWCELRGGRLGTDINKLRRHEEACILTNAVACRGYICTEVEDANGQRGFVLSWRGPCGDGCTIWATVDDLVTGREPTIKLVGLLTPKNVVFRKGN